MATEADETIIQLFWNRSENAIPALAQKYGDACLRLAKNLLPNVQDAEECLNDAYLGVWNAIPPQRPTSLKAYLLGIVRHLALHRHRSNTAQRRNASYDVALGELESALASVGPPEEQLMAEELTASIQRWLDTLSPENRVLFLRRYWYGDPIPDIAARCSLRENTVSVRLSRLRTRLRRHLGEEGLCETADHLRRFRRTGPPVHPGGGRLSLPSAAKTQFPRPGRGSCLHSSHSPLGWAGTAST